MCEPTTMAVVAAVATGVQIIGNNKSVGLQVEAINKQNQMQADQISLAAGKELTDNAKKAYAERAAMRAGAAESGINLGSNSFLAAIQTTAMNQYNEQGTILYNEQKMQEARQNDAQAKANSLQKDTVLSGALKIAGSAASAYAMAGGFSSAAPGAAKFGSYKAASSAGTARSFNFAPGMGLA